MKVLGAILFLLPIVAICAMSVYKEDWKAAAFATVVTAIALTIMAFGIYLMENS